MITAIIITTCSAVLTAADTDWNSNYKEGNIVLSLAAGLETGKTLEIAAYPAIDLGLRAAGTAHLKFKNQKKAQKAIDKKLNK